MERKYLILIIVLASLIVLAGVVILGIYLFVITSARVYYPTIEKCDKYGSGYMYHGMCYAEIAMAHNNITICNKLNLSAERDLCLKVYNINKNRVEALNEKNFSKCIDNEFLPQDYICAAKLAYELNDPSLCKNLVNLSDFCLYLFVYISNDKTACNLLKPSNRSIDSERCLDAKHYALALLNTPRDEKFLMSSK